MNWIATYSDKSQFGQRKYHLYSDRITVQHRDPVAVDIDTTILLKDLRPDYDRISMRSGNFNSGMWMLLCGGVVYWTVIEMTDADPFELFPGLFLGLAVAGGFVLLVGLRKQHFVRFKPRPPATEVLDIIRAGRRKSEFDGFVSRVQESIQVCQPNRGAEQVDDGNAEKPSGDERKP